MANEMRAGTSFVYIYMYRCIDRGDYPKFPGNQMTVSQALGLTLCGLGSNTPHRAGDVLG